MEINKLETMLSYWGIMYNIDYYQNNYRIYLDECKEQEDLRNAWLIVNKKYKGIWNQPVTIEGQKELNNAIGYLNKKGKKEELNPYQHFIVGYSVSEFERVLKLLVGLNKKEESNPYQHFISRFNKKL